MKGGKSLTKAGSKNPKQRRKFRRRKEKSTNDPALSTALTFTGAAGAGLLGKKLRMIEKRIGQVADNGKTDIQRKKLRKKLIIEALQRKSY